MTQKHNQISLRKNFFNLQSQMIERLRTNCEGILHTGTKGDGSELNWLNLLNTYLPKRYQSAKAFVVDSQERISAQIDVVVFDCMYSPFLFCQDSAIYVPAESVYAVMEVKELIDSQALLYAAEKAQSVRSLVRTTVPFRHAGGICEAKAPPHILAAALARRTTFQWPSDSGGLHGVDKLVTQLPPLARLDLGCILEHGAFDIRFPDPQSTRGTIEWSDPKEALIFFFIRLLTRLQQMGTVPALDLDAYWKKSRRLHEVM